MLDSANVERNLRRTLERKPADDAPRPQLRDLDGNEVQTPEHLAAGTRVIVVRTEPHIVLRGDHGTIEREDDWPDYYWVHLDRPAVRHSLDGFDYPEVTIRVAAADLLVLYQPGG